MVAARLTDLRAADSTQVPFKKKSDLENAEYRV